MRGVQPGAVTDDAIVTISDSPPAPTGGVPPLIAAPGFTVDGIGYEFYLVDKGVYEVARLDRSTYVYGNAKLVVLGDMALDSTAALALAPGASLTLYVFGSISVKSGNVVNTGGRARSLMIYGMNTCTSVQFAGSASYIGQLHAPYANVHAGGGGSGPLGFCGALTAKSLTMIGHFSFHFDESLLGSGNRLRNVILTWNEL